MLHINKYSFFYLLIVAFCCISCSKDDGPISPIKAELKGVWSCQLYSFDGQITSVFPDSVSNSSFEGFAYDIEFDMIYSENPNMYSLVGPYLLENTVLGGGQTNVFFTSENFNEQGTWSIAGNTITLNLNGITRNAGISELTDNSLIIRISTTSSEVGSDNFSTRTTNITETYMFGRSSF